MSKYNRTNKPIIVKNIIDGVEKTKKSKKLKILIIFILLLFLLIFCSKKNDNDLVYEVSFIKSDSIAEIEINGVIIRDDFRIKQLKEIKDNKNIKAVIIRIDSPGGMITPSEILFDSINKINAKKPTVVLMESVGASGGYMAALGSDYIIARNSTLTGSIGVVMESYNFVNLAEKIGIELKSYKSSKLKAVPSPFEKNDSETEKILQNSIDDMYNYFKEIVRNRRKNITQENFEISVNGQVFTGREALKLGLIDEIGDKNSALEYLNKKKNINTNKLPIIRIELMEKQKSGISLEKLLEKVSFEIMNRLNIIH
jgi:protease-4